ncbi:unnamed protein product, partial [Staurois parvus]
MIPFCLGPHELSVRPCFHGCYLTPSSSLRHSSWWLHNDVIEYSAGPVALHFT